MEDLRGKVCVVTGGAGGIGLAMARRFRAAGMEVVLGDVDEAALAAAAAEMAGALGVCCDVTSPEANDRLRDAALERFGAVHVVCLNAGIAPMAPLLDTPVEMWQRLLDVNVLGVVHGTRTFGPLLVEQQEGHLVLTASGAGLSSSPSLGAYSATKHAVVGIAATLRDELGRAGVGVSVLCPGVLKTGIGQTAGTLAPAFLPRYQQIMENAPGPEIAADAVHAAVLENRLFVLPSPEINGIIERRLDEIRAALPPV